MEIKDAQSLIEILRTKDDNEVKKALEAFEQGIIERTCDNAWSKIRRYIFWSANHRKNLVKNEILNYDEESGFLSVRSFNRFFQKVENTAKEQWILGDVETKDAITEILDSARNSLGSIPIDFRMNYSNEA